MLADPGNPFPHEQVCVLVCVGVCACGSHEHVYAIHRCVLVCEHKRPTDLSKRKETESEGDREGRVGTVVKELQRIMGFESCPKAEEK